MGFYIKLLCWLHELGVISEQQFSDRMLAHEASLRNQIFVIDV